MLPRVESQLMYRVSFHPSGRSVFVPAGTTLLDAALRAAVPLARGCGGDGLCGRCGLRVPDAATGLPPETADERCAKLRNRVDTELRLACRVRVRGDLDVHAPYG